MFKESKRASQLDLFTHTHGLLNEKALKVYSDNKEWHNQFRVQITERIDEELFRPLFTEGSGAPNSSIRVLVGMMILKEAHGWSDSQLFDNCQFHVRVRSALGLVNLNDSVPVSSTYYLLRKRIVEWEQAGNGNLLEKVFAQVTKSQIVEFKVNGDKIRMDSKILGSNIAWLSRYELIHETVRLAYLSLNGSIDNVFTSSELSLLKEITTETCSNVSYHNSDSQLKAKLAQLGSIIYKIIKNVNNKATKPVDVLREVFYHHYEVISEEAILLPKERLESGGIESPHDTDCRFRKKNDQNQKGYSINVTETCNPNNSLNLTTDIIVEPANAPDNKFLIPAIEDTQKIISEKIKTVNTDGGYHSEINQKYCKEKNLDFILSAICGRSSRYDLIKDENDNLIVTDLLTNTIIPSIKVKTINPESPEKWKIANDNGRKRLFTQKDIDICKLRKQIANRTIEEKNLRNNVEATIFQLGYHYRGNKSQYRGIIKHRIWANVRCLWINFVRIMKYIESIYPKCDLTVKNSLLFMLKSIFQSKFELKICFDKIYSNNRLNMLIEGI